MADSVTWVPGGPLDGLSVAPGVTVKGVVLVPVPPGVVMLIAPDPVSGTLAVALVSDFTFKPVI